MDAEKVLDNTDKIGDVHDFDDPALHVAEGRSSKHCRNTFLPDPTRAARVKFTTRSNIHDRLLSQQSAVVILATKAITTQHKTSHKQSEKQEQAHKVYT
jgi:hypothetical protein